MDTQNRENKHFFNYYEAFCHNITFEKFVAQTQEFWQDRQNLSPHYNQQMKKLLLSCKPNIARCHDQHTLRKNDTLKDEIIALQHTIIEAQAKIQSLQSDIKNNAKQAKSEIIEFFNQIKNA